MISSVVVPVWGSTRTIFESPDKGHEDFPIARIDGETGGHRLLTALKFRERNDVASGTGFQGDLNELVQCALAHEQRLFISRERDPCHVASTRKISSHRHAGTDLEQRELIKATVDGEIRSAISVHSDVARTAHFVSARRIEVHCVVTGKVLEPRLCLASVTEESVPVSVNESGQRSRSVGDVPCIIAHTCLRHEQGTVWIHTDAAWIVKTGEDDVDRRGAGRIGRSRG